MAKKAQTNRKDTEENKKEKETEIVEEDIIEKTDTESEPSEEDTAPTDTDAEEKSDAAPEDIEQKLKETEDKLLRTYAEYDNFRKRTQKEKETMFSDGQIAAITEMLGAIDNLERALTVPVESEDAKQLAKGVELTLTQFKEALTKMNVTPIETEGQTFDPEKHNAVMHVEDDSFGSNAIVEELMKGYQYKDKVIRHSMVKVAN